MSARLLCLVALALTLARSASAEDRFALIVSGAAGGPEYGALYSKWTNDLSRILTERMKLDPAHLVVLSDTERADLAATADNVRRTVASFKQRMTKDDLAFIVLIGHGTFDGLDAKFNLVGRDLESAEWGSLIGGLPGRLVVINSSSASFPFLERLAGPRRVVITSSDSPAQKYDTVFAEYFIKAFIDDTADLDKNGRISIWEAFASASAGVTRHYQRLGQLATERPLLDDTGDGIGKEASDPKGEDGALASRTYLDEDAPGAAPTDDVLLKLLQRKSVLQAEVEDLKIRKQFMSPDEYQKEFERIMIELAKVSKDARERQR